MAARMWARSPDATLRMLATPSRRATKLHGGASNGPAVHPFFEVLDTAAERHWGRGSGLKPSIKRTEPAEEPIKSGLSFAEWLKLLGASVADARRLPGAAVVLSGRHASGPPDVVALVSPDGRAPPAAVLVRCENDQQQETEHTWKESVLSVLDGFVQMGAPAFELSKCRDALGLPEQDATFYAPEWRGSLGNRGAKSARCNQAPEAFKLRFAFNAGAVEQGSRALNAATADCFVVVQCRALPAPNGHMTILDYGLSVERAVRNILKAHATAGSPHARCVYVRTHPGDARLAPVLAKVDGSGFLMSEPGLSSRD
jgi:hypothetical protein